MDLREGGLLRWQWSGYLGTHCDRRNLVLHAATAPVFIAGAFALLSSPLLGSLAAAGGVGAMGLSLVAQRRGHRLEGKAPAAFRGPLDVIARFFAEQFVTFPRFILSGRFAAAWRKAGLSAAPSPSRS